MKKEKGFLLSEFLKKNEGKDLRFYPCRILSGVKGTYGNKDWNYNYDLTPYLKDNLIVIVKGREEVEANRHFINYLSTRDYIFTPRNSYCDDFRIEPVSKKEYKEVRKKYDDYCMKNLKNSLGHSFYVGSDPELFVKDIKGDLIAAYDFLPDEDTASKQGSDKVFWDGFQAEFTHRAGSCLDDMTGYMRTMLYKLRSKAREHNPDAVLSMQNVVEISSDVLNDAKDEHVAFGCSPSLNIYNSEGLVDEGRNVPFRTAGGHMHFGIGKKSDDVILNIVKALDAIVGVACVSMFDGIDNPMRRTMYGLAGEYRLPQYGIEYRTLSNAWLAHPTITHLVFGLARKAIVIGEKDLLRFFKCNQSNAMNIINTCNVASARRIMRNNKEFYLELFKACYGDNYGIHERAYDVFYKGLNKTLEKPDDIAGNWGLDNDVEHYRHRRFSSKYMELNNNGKLQAIKAS